MIFEDAIAKTYDFPTGILSAEPVSSGLESVTLTTGSGFPVTSTIIDIDTNGVYMTIVPGTYSLTVHYQLRNETDDPDRTVEGTVTEYVDLTCEAGEIYGIMVNLSPQELSSEYYMRDARKEYWYGFKNVQPRDALGYNNNYPKNQNADPNRQYYVPSAGVNWVVNTAVDRPIANQTTWYTQKGDLHRDGTEPRTLFGCLRKGRMQLKKQEVIITKNHTTPQNMYAAYNGFDYHQVIYRFPEYSFSSNGVVNGRSEKPKAANYFYLPVKGFYRNRQLQYVSGYGYYWSAIGSKQNPKCPLSLNFPSISISLGSNYQSYSSSERLKCRWTIPKKSRICSGNQNPNINQTIGRCRYIL